jgi:hypothetical protein
MAREPGGKAPRLFHFQAARWMAIIYMTKVAASSRISPDRPTDPTPEMIAAGLDVFETTYLGGGEYAFGEETMVQAYRAMLAVAPTQGP